MTANDDSTRRKTDPGIDASEAERDRELERQRARELRLLRGLNHDLKNPLGAVDGYAQLLLEGIKGELKEGQRELINRMREATGTALRMADQMSQLATLQGGRAAVTPSRIDVAATIAEVLETLDEWRDRETVRVEVTAPADQPAVRTDHGHLRTVIDGLLRHAIANAGPGGRVLVDAEVTEGEDGPLIHIAVEDTGTPVDSEAADRFFEPFSRLEPELERGGALELTLAWESARVLGGEMRVAPPREEWSNLRFEVRLPADTPARRTGVR